MVKEDIRNAYTTYLLEHGERPRNVFVLMKSMDAEEAQFYAHYASFETIEHDVFTSVFEATHAVLEKDEDFQSYDAKGKTLAFYYTAFEMMTANRSLILMLLHHDGELNLEPMDGFKEHFLKFIASMTISEMINMIPEKNRATTVDMIAWYQFKSILKYWIEDTSPSFEKTDVFIEKSLAASFELVNIQMDNPIVDYGKMIFKEKIKPMMDEMKEKPGGAPWHKHMWKMKDMKGMKDMNCAMKPNFMKRDCTKKKCTC